MNPADWTTHGPALIAGLGLTNPRPITRESYDGLGTYFWSDLYILGRSGVSRAVDELLAREETK